MFALWRVFFVYGLRLVTMIGQNREKLNYGFIYDDKSKFNCERVLHMKTKIIKINKKRD